MGLPHTTELIDLHIHAGGAVAPHVLWAIAHDHGFKLPVKSYWDFCDLVTADANKVASLNDYLKIMHEWTEKIQSSPSAIERRCFRTSWQFMASLFRIEYSKARAAL